MPKTSYFRNQMLELIFNGDALPDLAENDTTSPATSLFVSLHTADPGLAGTQNSSEASYGGYARQAVARSAGGWVVTGNAAKLNSQLNFPVITSGAQTLTHFGIGLSLAGVGTLLYSGTLTPTIPVQVGFAPPALKNDTVVIET